MSDFTPRIAYVVKCYPRYSETFIVNEILAHEAAGLVIDIFSLRHTTDTHFQNALSRVRASVTYLPTERPKGATLWEDIGQTAAVLPHVWRELRAAHGTDVLDVMQALTLAREIRRRGITHLHAHFGNSAASVAMLAARIAGVPYTFTAHAKDIFHEQVDRPALRRRLARAAAVVTVSDYNVAYLRREYGAAAARVRRIYNGLDLAHFPYASAAQRPPRIVAVGRLVEKKGFEDLIDACALLRRRGVPFDCCIVGSGPLESRLRACIDQQQLGGTVELIGPRPQAEVIRLVQDAAVFAAPCVESGDGDRDGMPTVLLEAMALGTPCVSTAVTGIPEVLHDGETGLIVRQKDAGALAAALERLLRGPELRAHLSLRARQRIEQHFDVHASAAQLRDVFAAARSYVPARAPQRRPRQVA